MLRNVLAALTLVALLTVTGCEQPVSKNGLVSSESAPIASKVGNPPVVGFIENDKVATATVSDETIDVQHNLLRIDWYLTRGSWDVGGGNVVYTLGSNGPSQMYVLPLTELLTAARDPLHKPLNGRTLTVAPDHAPTGANAGMFFVREDYPRVSPAGDHVVFSRAYMEFSTSSGAIVAVDFATGAESADVDHCFRRPNVSSDGATVRATSVMAIDPANGRDVRRQKLAVDGHLLTDLAPIVAEHSPIFSKDGKWVVFVGSFATDPNNPTDEVFVYNRTSMKVRQLTNNGGPKYSPRFLE